MNSLYVNKDPSKPHRDFFMGKATQSNSLHFRGKPIVLDSSQSHPTSCIYLGRFSSPHLFSPDSFLAKLFRLQKSTLGFPCPSPFPASIVWAAHFSISSSLKQASPESSAISTLPLSVLQREASYCHIYHCFELSLR